MEKDTKIKPFEYRNHTIRMRNGLISLTDLWKASETPIGKHDPRDWKRRAGQSFIDAVAEKLNVSTGRIYQTTRGAGGGSWAHWQIALAYAKYLSHDLHMHVNEIYVRYQAGDVSLAEEISDKASPEEQKRLAKRLAGKQGRLTFTDTLKEHGVTKGKDFAICTDAIYDPLLGGTTKELKQQRNLPKKASLRDNMSIDELAAVFFTEVAASRKIKRKDVQGVTKCAKTCRSTAEKVSDILHGDGDDDEE
jgi:hypothetical protein